ncbi:plant UBX domain-containing protein 7-like [Argentina anserina]|uniref:plant UBX domain-containing protein 7-like n=1 Tax=Argentina anserina TaxID=57926 RepID=UPI0021765B6B|nr:plant UBX domain-containing protein 7-like [Potentilla anserina]
MERTCSWSMGIQSLQFSDNVLTPTSHPPSELLYQQKKKHPFKLLSRRKWNILILENKNQMMLNSQVNLAPLYHPPYELLFQGSFKKLMIQAKRTASVEDKWFPVNLQSTKEISSHMINQDTWAHEAVSKIISTNFIFWQAYDDSNEVRKICTYYNLVYTPVVLIIDPINGENIRSWYGMVQPECLLEASLQLTNHLSNYRNHLDDIQ